MILYANLKEDKICFKLHLFSSNAQNIIHDLQDGAEQYLCN